MLGPAFVKIGQAVSSRPDAVPPVYIKQLEYLQVPPPPRPSDFYHYYTVHVWLSQLVCHTEQM